MSAQRTRGVPTFPIVAGIVLCVAGLAVSGYLTIEHFDTSVALACPETSRINCQKVTTSQYSTLLGVPVALLGLGYFVIAALLMSPAAWRSSRAGLSRARLAWSGLGMLMVIYLVWAEFFGANAICPWCTGVHAITLLLFALVMFTEAWILPEPSSP